MCLQALIPGPDRGYDTSSPTAVGSLPCDVEQQSISTPLTTEPHHPVEATTVQQLVTNLVPSTDMSPCVSPAGSFMHPESHLMELRNRHNFSLTNTTSTL
ncbi:unnamed protein product [Protopolystoma xenopodis]|uniref:Uncharacterized protein n=1 Tax=Protopolystoma xenopodis TaxID=117903 RepID=A0A3S5ADR6_9PLAT|nr:unnamed protein product [Protopolystoma xenopodis]